MDAQDIDIEENWEEEDEQWENSYQRILNIDDFTFENLKLMAKWGKRISIVVFIFSILIVFSGSMTVLLSLHFSILRHIGSIAFIVLSVIAAGILVYPAYELGQFSNLMTGALMNPHQGRFNAAIQHMKNTLRYSGILLMVMLTFSVVSFVVWMLL